MHLFGARICASDILPYNFVFAHFVSTNEKHDLEYYENTLILVHPFSLMTAHTVR